MKNKNKKILCIFSNILGHATVSRQYQRVLNGIEGAEITYFFLDNQDYVNFPSPAWVRFSCTLEVFFVARKKFKGLK